MALHKDTEMLFDALDTRKLDDGDKAALKRDMSVRLERGQSQRRVVDWAARMVKASEATQ